MRRLATITAAAACCLGLAACGSSTEGLLGAELYEQSCAGCHGATGGGGLGPAIGPGSNSVNLQDDQLAAVIVVGPGSMPAFPRLNDDQVDSLVTYLRDLQAR
jgi:mono/diheme cytochrome c family protein